MAPVRPAAATPTITPAVFFRSDLRVSLLIAAEDSTALRSDESESVRTFGMRHLTRLAFLQNTSRAAQCANGRASSPKYSRMARIILQQHFSRKVVPKWVAGQFAIRRLHGAWLRSFANGHHYRWENS